MCDYQLSYLATGSVEIDLVIETPQKETWLIECKSSTQVKDLELKNLNTFVSEIKQAKAFCICREPRQRLVGKTLVLPWQEALTALFNKEV